MDSTALEGHTFGILDVAMRLLTMIETFIANPRGLGAVAASIKKELTDVVKILYSLDKAIRNAPEPATRLPIRTTFIKVDQLIDTFTDGVLVLTDIESRLSSCNWPDVPFPQRFVWAFMSHAVPEALGPWIRRYDELVGSIAALRSFQISLSALLKVVQCTSRISPTQSQEDLESNILKILENNNVLATPKSLIYFHRSGRDADHEPLPLLKPPQGSSAPQIPATASDPRHSSIADGLQLSAPSPVQKTDIELFLGDEDAYTEKLTTLFDMKAELIRRSSICVEELQDVFGDVDTLYFHQQDFYKRLVVELTRESQERLWGSVFLDFKPALENYLVYLKHHGKRMDTIAKWLNQLQTAPGMSYIWRRLGLLVRYIMAPIMRLPAYLSFLEKLEESEELSETQKSDVEKAVTAITKLLDRAHRGIARQEYRIVAEHFSKKVQDWKGLRHRQLGRLLQFGNFTMLVSSTTPSEPKRRILRSLYLFERYIIIGMNVQGEKGREIQIVGRISFDDVSTIFPYAPMPMPGRTLLLRNTPYFSHPLGRGFYMIQIFYRLNMELVLHPLSIVFPTEAVMLAWSKLLLRQRGCYAGSRRSMDGDSSAVRSVDEPVKQPPPTKRNRLTKIWNKLA